MARALIALHDTQIQHMKSVEGKHPEEETGKRKRLALEAALGELKTQLRTHDRSLRIPDYEVLRPIVEEVKCDLPPLLEHHAWELCLKGNKDFPIWISDHLQTCRTVSPLIVGTETGWVSAVSGGSWPTSSTNGLRVGLRTNPHARTIQRAPGKPTALSSKQDKKSSN